MVVNLLILLALTAVQYDAVHHDDFEPSASHAGEQEIAMSQKYWSAGFVDTDDLGAVERWARGMCQGLDVERTAAELGTETSIVAVATALTSNLPEPAGLVALQTCEEELMKANATRGQPPFNG